MFIENRIALSTIRTYSHIYTHERFNLTSSISLRYEAREKILGTMKIFQ